MLPSLYISLCSAHNSYSVNLVAFFMSKTIGLMNLCYKLFKLSYNLSF